MQRRGFLKLLGSIPIVAVAPKVLASIAEPVLARYTHQTISMGFALTEEMALAPPRLAMSGMLCRAEFARQLAAGLNEVFSREYDKAALSNEWQQCFGGDLNDVSITG